MELNDVVGKEAARMYHSFGKIRKGLVVKYIWRENIAEMYEEDGWWSIEQEVYKRVYNNPDRRWEMISNCSKSTKKICKFVEILERNGFSANWPSYEMPCITCAIKY